MTTSELISYIRKQIQNNISKDLIISKLLGVGWHREDIDEGFLSVESELKPKISFSDTKKEIDNINPLINEEKVIDKYHEPIVGDNIFEIKKESPKVETPKVWTPMNIPVKEIAPSAIHQESEKEDNLEVKTGTTQIEIQNLELQPKKPVLPQTGREELIPTLMPKSVVNSFGSINNNNKENLTKPNTPITSNEPPKNSLANNLPKMAMLSSYQNDLSLVNKIKKENIKKNDHKITKWLVLVLVIFIIASVIWVFASGYIKIKNLNFSFIKKDPKVLLLNNSKVLSSLKSYKTETNIEVKSPSFSDITYGLLSGEAVSSGNTDSILVNALGVFNQNETGLMSDNFITIKGSILPNYITTEIKNNGQDLFISVPDLSQIIKESISESSIVKINEQQFDLVPSLFSPNIEIQLKKINFYQILSSGISSYVNSETLVAYNELINSVEIMEKGQENIKGIETYHYSINADRQLAKNLLTRISNNFTLNLSEEDQNRITEILGAISINSFEVWVGKGDNNIYQYSVVINIPLSKVIGFGDKSIGNNTVNISWKTTYYDFDIPNNIFIPEGSIPMADFVKNVKETKIRNNVSSFKQLATNLFDIEKSYGKKSNTNGSCMNPVSGSLFSPTGHIKNASTVVGDMSLFLNNILEKTGGIGSCYSTTKAWSFAIPISDNYDPASIPEGGYTSFYCVDSTGSQENLTSLPTGVVCLPKVDTTETAN